jgi:hypothetical protein
MHESIKKPLITELNVDISVPFKPLFNTAQTGKLQNVLLVVLFEFG